MSTDDQTPAAPPADERIRKVYAKDLKVGDAVHTVFRTARKEKHTSRGGKTFLSLVLQDRTGELDARIFEAVDTMEKAFIDGDYLLIRGKVGVFHGKNQVVLETIDRLDPTPLDAKEFTPPPAPATPPRAPKSEAGPARHEVSPEAKDARKAARSRIMRLLDDPAVLDGVAAFLRHLDAWADSRASGEPAVEPRRPKQARGPRVEHRPEVKPTGAPPTEAPPEPKKPERDASLPGKFAFKPFNAIAGSEPMPVSTLAGSEPTPVSTIAGAEPTPEGATDKAVGES